MNTPQIAAEVAAAEFDRFIDLNAIDANESAMNGEERLDFAKVKTSLLARIVEGSLVIGENGEATYTPKKSKDCTPIVFKEPTGAAFLAMDRKKKGEDSGKLFATMGEMAHVDPKTFALMALSDTKVCVTIATLFLA